MNMAVPSTKKPVEPRRTQFVASTAAVEPERSQTDESLRAERSESDRAIDTQRASEAKADDLLDRERLEADAALESARAQADSDGDGVSAGESPGTIASKRATADDTMERARDASNVALNQARSEHHKILEGLLPLEREKTDRHLFTERARTDDALANRDDFLGIVSHDLRNLLSGVVLEADMLSHRAKDTDEGRAAVAHAKSILRYAARMNRLVGDLVDVVSIDAGKLSVEHARIDFGAVVTQTVEAFQQSALRAGVTLTAECSGNLAADADGERMMQVLANMLGNALKFTPRGGRVAVICKRVKSSVCLSVTDMGPGIDPSLHEAVFERFWQRKEGHRSGLGLGLYLSRCIVESHGGRIWVESVPGEGASFHVQFDVVRKAPSKRKARAQRQ
jgi:signal transduction histidine kinase